MEALLQDLRISFRGLRRTPGTAFVAVTAFALGIGLTTLVFSIVWGVMIRGLPFEDSQEIVALRRTNPSIGAFRMGVTIHDLTDWRAEQRSFDGLAGYTNRTLSLSDDANSPQRLDGCLIEPEMFGVLGVAPITGRAFTRDDAATGAAPVMLIGWGVWQQRFGGDPGIVGSTVRINGEATTVIGVMPRGFGFPGSQNAWLPLKLDPLQLQRGQGGGLQVFGRLRDGVTVEQAAADIERIAQRLAAEYPATNEGVGSRVYDFTDDMLGTDVRTALYAMFGSVIFVLLIACANVTNLLMARAMMRAREVGVRTALGASRLRVASQFLTEAFALSLTGAMLGIGIAAFGIRLFNNAIADKRPPFWIDVRLDGMALFWTFLAMAAATLLAGALPAIQAARASTSEILKDESRGGSSFRLGRISRALVAGEMALSVGLLVGAGLMIKSVVKVQTVDLGFDSRQVYVARIALQQAKYTDSQRRIAFHDELLARVRALPDVELASLTSSAPGLRTGWTTFAIEGASYLTDRDYPGAALIYVTPGFFEAVDATVAVGRGFTPADRE
ncbi:MAG: ABC transporter permease, partial [Gemmatimonadota bacterium]